MYTHVLNKRLTRLADQEEKILEKQAGFREGYSTVDHIFYVIWTCAKIFTTTKNTKLYVTFVDFEEKLLILSIKMHYGRF